MTARIQNLDGVWTREPDAGGYELNRAGSIVVRYDAGEPDGELVADKPVGVHIERMSPGHWSLILYEPDSTRRVVATFYSKKRINVLWRAEG